jgi:hypothetical protein
MKSMCNAKLENTKESQEVTQVLLANKQHKCVTGRISDIKNSLPITNMLKNKKYLYELNLKEFNNKATKLPAPGLEPGP